MTQSDLSSCLKDKNYEKSVENILLFDNRKNTEETSYFAKDLIRPSLSIKEVNATERTALRKDKFTTDFRSLYHTISKDWNHTSSTLLSRFPTIPLLKI